MSTRAFVIKPDKVDEFMNNKCHNSTELIERCKKYRRNNKMIMTESEMDEQLELMEEVHEDIPKIKMTNSEHISLMSAEEKARWIVSHDNKSIQNGYWTYEQILEWLQSEVKE